MGEAGGDIRWRLKTPSANPRPPDLNFTSTGSAFAPSRSHFHLTLWTTEPPDMTHKSHGGAGGGAREGRPGGRVAAGFARSNEGGRRGRVWWRR